MPHYTEMNCEEVQVEETTTKTDNKNKNLGKFEKKAIYLNHGKYGYFLNHNKINYKISEWLPVPKLDLEIASKLLKSLIEYNKENYLVLGHIFDLINKLFNYFVKLISR